MPAVTSVTIFPASSLIISPSRSERKFVYGPFLTDVNMVPKTGWPMRWPVISVPNATIKFLEAPNDAISAKPSLISIKTKIIGD